MSLTATAVAVMISSVAPQAEAPATIDPISTSMETVQSAPVTAADQTMQAGASQTDAGQTAAGQTAAGQTGAGQADGRASPTPAARDIGDENEIIVMPRKPPPPGDPLERVNEQSFKVTQAVDQAVLEPVAKVYNKGLPRPVRQGLRNFFSNLSEPVVFVAYLLELKPGKAAETAGRFAINTTIGAAGLVDMAKRKPFNLPYRPNGLANVLGYYGVGPGPYFYLPIVGPTTLRDIIGDTVDRALLPAVVGSPLDKPEFVIPSSILSQLGERAAFDEEIRKIRKEDNPYAFYRELYLQQRKAEIEALHGRFTPGVVPVYGPAMRTAGGKEKSGDQKLENQQPGEAKPVDGTPGAGSPAPATPPAETVPQDAGPTPVIAPEPVQP